MSAIKKGDLVIVARGMTCCGTPTGTEGTIFVVTRFTNANPQKCLSCGAITSIAGATGDGVKQPYDIDRLKKIDPPATGEYDRVPVRMKEPA